MPQIPGPSAPRDLVGILAKTIIKRDALKELRNVLMNLYQDEASIRRVAHDSAIDLSRISLNSNPINNWYKVLEEASKINQVDALLSVVEQEYGKNVEFQKARDNYRQPN